MIRSMILGLGLALAASGSAGGQSQSPMSTDTTITLGDGEFRVCPDRPPRPDWVENIQPKEAYRALMIEELYARNSYRDIVESENCSCETRFPDWSVAQAEYDTSYSFLDEPEHTEAQRIVRREGSHYRPMAKSRCELQGNW